MFESGLHDARVIVHLGDVVLEGDRAGHRAARGKRAIVKGVFPRSVVGPVALGAVGVAGLPIIRVERDAARPVVLCIVTVICVTVEPSKFARPVLYRCRPTRKARCRGRPPGPRPCCCSSGRRRRRRAASLEHSLRSRARRRQASAFLDAWGCRIILYRAEPGDLTVPKPLFPLKQSLPGLTWCLDPEIELNWQRKVDQPPQIPRHECAGRHEPMQAEYADGQKRAPGSGEARGV